MLLFSFFKMFLLLLVVYSVLLFLILFNYNIVIIVILISDMAGILTVFVAPFSVRSRFSVFEAFSRRGALDDALAVFKAPRDWPRCR